MKGRSLGNFDKRVENLPWKISKGPFLYPDGFFLYSLKTYNLGPCNHHYTTTTPLLDFVYF